MSENKEQPILTLIQDIKDGRVSPDTVDKEMRKQCIEVFRAEGYSVPHMAQILNKCEKTIRRDIAEITEENELSPSVDLAKKLVGEIVVYGQIHKNYLMRLARSPNTSVSEKAQAEYFAHKVSMDMVDRLQSLGYLPKKAQEIIADFSHHFAVDDDKTFKEIKTQIDEIEKVSTEYGELTPEIKIELKELKQRIEKAEIETKVIDISNKQKEEVKNVE